MPLPKINPTTTQAWQKLKQHFEVIKNVKMQDMFALEVSRIKDFTIQWNDFEVDYSKNRINAETKDLLLQLANEIKLKKAIDAQFSGKKINETEDREVLHTALRDFNNMKPEVKMALSQMEQFSEAVISGKWKGHTGKIITDVVNIGIGGSHLGPEMVVESLKFYGNHLKIHFISNIDGDHVSETLKNLNPETSLFITVSKTFTTQETLTNAQIVKDWFLENANSEAIAKHFVAVSTNLEAAENFGIANENIFPIWDWVGGRFSLWSAVGLSICCSVGYKNFEQLLHGANAMDIHFKEAHFSENIPVMLALLSVWYNNFFKSETEAVLPYSQYLSKFKDYLQQASMESNGKSVDRNGNFIDYQTGTIIWGNTGSNAQHAFLQLLHQGTKLIPTDFIGFKKSLHNNNDNHKILMANFFAQTEALLNGTNGETVENNFKFFEGNKPTNTILIEKLTPRSLGSLLAIYEHKIFAQGIIWNIFSYDQFGVELGKKIAKEKLSN